MKRVHSVIVFVAAALPAAAQIGLGLSPMRIELRTENGGITSGPLTISNGGSSKVRVRAEVLDFYIDESGTPQFAKSFPTESESSCKQWMSLNPVELEVPAQNQVDVRYTARIPAELPARSYHCAVGFTTMATSDNVATVGLKTAVRVVAAFYIVNGNPGIEGQLTGMKLESAGAAGWRAVVTVKNWGYMYFRPVGEIALLDPSGAVVHSAQFIPMPVLPKREQRYVFPVSASLDPDKRYTLRAKVDIGMHELQEATAEVTLH